VLKRRACAIERLESRFAFNVTIIQAPANYEFVDMGYDPTTSEVAIVGYEQISGNKTAKLFELNTAQNGFDATTLVGFGAPTQVGRINTSASSTELCIGNGCSRLGLAGSVR
jgi:hypothetical protein